MFLKNAGSVWKSNSSESFLLLSKLTSSLSKPDSLCGAVQLMLMSVEGCLANNAALLYQTCCSLPNIFRFLWLEVCYVGVWDVLLTFPFAMTFQLSFPFGLSAAPHAEIRTETQDMGECQRSPWGSACAFKRGCSCKCLSPLCPWMRSAYKDICVNLCEGIHVFDIVRKPLKSPERLERSARNICWPCCRECSAVSEKSKNPFSSF